MKDQTGTNRRRVRKHQMCNCIKEHCREMRKIRKAPNERVGYKYQIPGKNKYFLPFNVSNDKYDTIETIIVPMVFCPFCGDRIISRDDE